MKRRSRDKMQHLADEELVGIYCDANADAFEVIYERHAKAAYSLAYRMCGSEALAETVTQEAFLSAWRNGASYRVNRGSVRNWILSIVHNRAVDQLRRFSVRERELVGESDLGTPSEATIEQEVERREQASLVKTVLSQLPVEQSKVIELAYFSGFTHPEIAAMLSLPVGTVKSRMRLGLQRMNVFLEASPSG